MSKKTKYLVAATIWAEGQALLPGELYTPATAAEAKRLLKAGVLAEAPSPTKHDDPAHAATEPGEPDQDQADADTGADADQDSAPGLDLEPPAGDSKDKADAKA